jgi:glycosyltransferase involved in cell wall biosynthesis
VKRVAIVHDWLTGMRGGERVLEALLDLFPDAEIYTLLHVPGSVSRRIETRPIHSSFVQRLPFAATRYRTYLPLFPAALERLDLSGFDLVLSSSHCVAKGATARAEALHVCYCHSPMRYVWDQYHAYFGPGRASAATRAAMRLLAPRLRRWDTKSAQRPTRLVANSAFVRDRIRMYWQRHADVVHPPVDVGRFTATARREDWYLIVAALVAYKRIDLAVRAFSRDGRRLVIVGEGPELDRLRALAAPGVTFTGRLSDEQVAALMARCRALVVPGVEDFGIATVEAQAAGAPVIAYGRGGSLETVMPYAPDNPCGTGILFDEPSAAALAAAVSRFERLSFDPAAAVSNAQRFRVELFHERMRAQVDAAQRG